ncbi:MAG: group 1 truncated hemoglobin [Steroidobacteraceae bacterium]
MGNPPVAHSLRLRLLAAGGLLLLAAAATVAAPQASLYQRMGGAPVVKAVVSDTLDRVTADPKLKRSFAEVDVERVKRLLAEQICALADGGCHYSGVSMSEAHGGHQISESEFYGLVEILRDSLRRHHVHLRERNELLALLAPLKREVVNAPAPTPGGTDP